MNNDTISEHYPLVNRTIIASFINGHRDVNSYINKRLKDLGLTATQFIILNGLRGQFRLGIAGLARYTGVDRTTASRELRALVMKGLLTPVRNLSDRHGNLIAHTLTPAGEEAHTKAYKIWTEGCKVINKWAGDNEENIAILVNDIHNHIVKIEQERKRTKRHVKE